MSINNDPDFVRAEIAYKQAQIQEHQARTIGNLIQAGFTRESAIKAVISNDLTELVSKSSGRKLVVG